MRKFLSLGSLVLVILLVAMISAAQDNTATPTPTEAPTETETPIATPTAATTQTTTTTNNNTSTTNNTLNRIQRWVEVRVGNTGNVGYVPASCVSDAQLENVVLWTGDRTGSLSGASQSLNEAGDNDFTGDVQILSTIYCDVALYSTPDGEQVANTRLIPGQTWFISPYVYVTDANAATNNNVAPTRAAPAATPRGTTGQARSTDLPIEDGWAEVIIGNTGQQVYIPASCVPNEPYNEIITWTGSRSGSFVDAAQQESPNTTGNNITDPTLVTVLCDVTVRSAPGGPVVEDAQLRAGQTWYVTPYLWTQEDNAQAAS